MTLFRNFLSRMTVIACLLLSTSVASADECKDLGEAINTASRTALQNLTPESDKSSEGRESAAISKAASQEIFAKCARFIEIKCDKYNWIGTTRSMKAYCQAAIVTDLRHRENASKELLQNSSEIKGATSSKGPAGKAVRATEAQR